jgi:hypothetical protein
MYEQQKNDPKGEESKGINWAVKTLLVKWDGTDQAATCHRLRREKTRPGRKLYNKWAE